MELYVQVLVAEIALCSLLCKVSAQDSPGRAFESYQIFGTRFNIVAILY